jgi:hypothetical protein
LEQFYVIAISTELGTRSYISPNVFYVVSLEERFNSFLVLEKYIFHDNDVTHEETEYYAKIDEEFGDLRTASLELPDGIKKNIILDISGTYEGLRILAKKPAGYIGAGPSSVVFYYALRYWGQNLIKLYIYTMDCEVQTGDLGISNIFIESVTLEKHLGGVLLTIKLTENARFYTVGEGQVLCTPEYFDGMQTHFTYKEIIFSAGYPDSDPAKPISEWKGVYGNWHYGEEDPLIIGR